MNENEVYAKPPESLIEKAKDVVRQYYSCARCGIYNTRNILGDSMTTVFSENGLEIDVCFYWEYFEVFGLTSEEFAELEKFYSTLYGTVVTKKMNENERPAIGSSEAWGPQGKIEIFWEWKEEDHVCVSVELSDSTRRLPYEIRRELVSRLKRKLTPSKRNAEETV